MRGEGTVALLRELAGPGASAAWIAFLEEYSPVMQQVIVLSTSDPDAQADCFVFVCEALADRDFRRLRKFNPGGSATFVTWLRAVVRNLCLDWRRKICGRFQPFSWTRGLQVFDQQVFRCVYQQGCTPDETLACLAPSNPGLTLSTIEEAADRVGAKITSRQRWLLSTRQVRVESLDSTDEADSRSRDVPDPSPDPEHALLVEEYRAALGKALRELAPADQLILQLRFEHDLSLQEIARTAQLKDAQSADRHIRNLLDRLRGRVSRPSPILPGKAKAVSV